MGDTRADVTAIAFDPAYSAPWRRLAPEIPLQLATNRRTEIQNVRDAIHQKRAELTENDFLTVMIPEILESQHLVEVFRHPRTYRLKSLLLRDKGVQVLDIPLLRRQIDPEVDQAHEPARNYAFVLVSGVHNATLQAIEYAETLRPTDLRAVTFGLDPEADSSGWATTGSATGSRTRSRSKTHPSGTSRVTTPVPAPVPPDGSTVWSPWFCQNS